MAREVKLHGPKVEHRRREVLLPDVQLTPDILDPASDDGTIIRGYVKLLDGSGNLRFKNSPKR